MGKLFVLVLLAAIGALAYSQAPEVRRYLKVRKM
jgi:uncharacterized protein DUF6893